MTHHAAEHSYSGTTRLGRARLQSCRKVLNSVALQRLRFAVPPASINTRTSSPAEKLTAAAEAKLMSSDFSARLKSWSLPKQQRAQHMASQNTAARP